MIAIIGSGPAGVSCALYLARANIPVVVFTNHKSSLLKAKKIENYYGVGATSGEELYYNGIKQLEYFHIPIYEEEVFNILLENSFSIETNKKKHSADAIVLATGVNPSKAKIPNLSKWEGKGISYCATCDGFFFKGKKIAVVGNGDFALHEYQYLSNLTTQITLVTNGKGITVDSHIKKIETPIREIIGEEKVTAISFEDNTMLEVDGIFIASDYPDSDILAQKTGVLLQNHFIVTNEKNETNITNLFACGDATGGIKQVSKAVEEGRKTAFQIIEGFSKVKN